MPLETWLAFLGASALLLVLPGPTILTVISYSITHGRRARLPLVLAVALGDSTALLLSQVGLGALLSASAFWFTVVKTVGGLYLLYLGFAAARRRGAGHAAPGGRGGIALEALCQHLSGDGAESQGHHLLRRLPAAVHRPGRRHGAPDVDPVGHLRDVRRPERRRLRAVRRPGAPPAGLAARSAASTWAAARCCRPPASGRCWRGGPEARRTRQGKAADTASGSMP